MKVNNNRVKKAQKKTISELSPQTLEAHPNYIMNVIERSRYQTDLHTMCVDYDALVSSDAGGVWQAVYQNNPSGYSGWSNLAATFDEYRVIGLCLQFEPLWFAGGTTVTTIAPVAVVIDYDSSANLSGYSQAAQYSSFREFPGQTQFTVIAPMSGAENATFIGTNSATTTYNIKCYSSGNSISLTFGRATLRAVVQFRGKGI